MRESTYTAAVRDALPAAILAIKVNNPLRRGLPDNLYVGIEGKSLWIEYKYDDIAPQKVDLTDPKRYLSKLQQKTLRQLYERGQQVAVVYATPERVWVREGLSWQNIIYPYNNVQGTMSRSELVRWIIKKLTPTTPEQHHERNHITR